MKSKLMVLTVFLLLALMSAPATAKLIGPRNAEKNPHMTISPDGVVLLTPGGVQNEWADTDSGVFDFFHILSASKTELPGATTFTIDEIIALMMNPEAALEFENKWGYISQETLLALLILMGIPTDEAETMAAMWPDGMYFRYVNVGK